MHTHELTTDELRQRLQEARKAQERARENVKELEQALLRRTPAVWIGEINRDDDGERGGDIFPISAEVETPGRSVNGDKVFLSYGKGDYQLTLTIDGEEDSFSWHDGSGRITCRAFRKHKDAHEWVVKGSDYLSQEAKTIML